MNQSRIESLVEAFVNVLIGYWVSVAAQMLIFPWFGVRLHPADNMLIGVLFTVVSLVRSYCLRRWFNARLQAAAKRIAEAAQKGGV